MPVPETIELASLRYVFACMKDREPRGGAYVYNVRKRDGGGRAVANSGWLLRHSADVHDLWVSTGRYKSLAVGGGLPYGRVDYRAEDGFDFDAVLAARMEGGAVYVTAWADRNLLHRWLHRPNLDGRPVHWEYKSYIIGSTDYRTLGVRT